MRCLNETNKLNNNHTNKDRPYAGCSRGAYNLLIFIRLYLGALLYNFIKT